MRYIIRGVPERKEHIDKVLEAIPHAEVVWDEGRDAMRTFLRAMEQAGDDPVVHMEDDLRLAKGFLRRAEQVIKDRPQTVVQFFSRRNKDTTVGSRWDRTFSAAVTFYFPAGHSRALVEYAKTWPHYEEHPTGLDYMIDDMLRARKEKHWIHIPNLVDHLSIRSAIGPARSTKRQSPTFNRSPKWQ